jgi:hypothetical protein
VIGERHLRGKLSGVCQQGYKRPDKNFCSLANPLGRSGVLSDVTILLPWVPENAERSRAPFFALRFQSSIPVVCAASSFQRRQAFANRVLGQLGDAVKIQFPHD